MTAEYPPGDEPLVPLPALSLPALRQAVAAVAPSRLPEFFQEIQDASPAFLASGIGIGLSGVAVQVAAFTGVKDKVSGLAGGMVSTAQEAGAALGLAIIATAALARSGQVTHAAGAETAVRAVAQTAGFQRGALVAAGFSIAAALAAGLLLRRAEHTAASARPQEPRPSRTASGMTPRRTWPSSDLSE